MPCHSASTSESDRRVELTQWVDARVPQDVVDVGVADSSQAGLVEQEGLDPALLPPHDLAELRKSHVQHVWPELGQLFVRLQRSGRQIMRVAEPPEVDGKSGPVGKVEDQPALLRKMLPVDQQDFAAHAHIQQKPALACLSHQPFAALRCGAQDRALECLPEAVHRDVQALRLEHLHSGNNLPCQQIVHLGGPRRDLRIFGHLAPPVRFATSFDLKDSTSIPLSKTPAVFLSYGSPLSWPGHRL